LGWCPFTIPPFKQILKAQPLRAGGWEVKHTLKMGWTSPYPL
jgi:hypothetical protein